MPSELIDGNTLRRVQNMLKGKGSGKVGKIYDVQSPDLTIRVYKATAAWAIVRARWTRPVIVTVTLPSARRCRKVSARSSRCGLTVSLSR